MNEWVLYIIITLLYSVVFMVSFGFAICKLGLLKGINCKKKSELITQTDSGDQSRGVEQ